MSFLAVGDAVAQKVASEPVLPVVDDQSAGYFPTIAEDTLLRGPYDSRSLGGWLGGEIEGPDTRGQVATDLFRYYDNNPDFYQRNQNFFRPINKTLGVFTPFDGWTVESRRNQFASFTVDANMSLLTRAFEPELAHIKAGPLYFDVLWAGAGVIYSDFNGDLTLYEGDSNDDGWLGYVELGVRGLLRITDSIYISAIANVIYLPFENELGLQLGNSTNPGLMFRLNINDVVAGWEILFFDQFQALSGLDIFVDADSPAIDQAGRYSFGFMSDRSNDFYNNRLAYFVNTVGFHASRLFFDNEWRLNFGIEHSDYWRSFSFDDHGKSDRLILAMQYEGSVLPFAPRFSYEYWSNDGYDSLLHQVQMQLNGRITENVNWRGTVGYAFSTGDMVEQNNFTWELALEQVLTRSTIHWIGVGDGYFYNEFQSDTRSARYARYGIDQRITNKFHIDAYAQYAYQEASANDRFPVRDRFGAGLEFHYRPLDFTDLSARAYYEQVDQSDTTDDTARWVYRLEWTQQLSSRLTGNVFYQYEEMNSLSRPFTEHLFGLSMRRYF